MHLVPAPLIICNAIGLDFFWIKEAKKELLGWIWYNLEKDEKENDEWYV